MPSRIYKGQDSIDWPIIEFENEEARAEYDRQMEAIGFHVFEEGVSISLDEVRARRFGPKEPTEQPSWWKRLISWMRG